VVHRFVGVMHSDENAEGRICRICFEEECGFEGIAAAENPLITPCACRGSAQFVHRCVLTLFVLCRRCPMPAVKRPPEPLRCPHACSRCLQACQVAGFASERRTTCGVCLQRYSEQLDVPAPPDLRPGDLLLASPSMSGTFRGSVCTPPQAPPPLQPTLLSPFSYAEFI